MIPSIALLTGIWYRHGLLAIHTIVHIISYEFGISTVHFLILECRNILNIIFQITNYQKYT